MGHTITAPQGDYSGISGGVVFRDGKGYLDDDAPGAAGALAYFEANGYGVTKGGSAGPEVPLSIDPSPGRAPASRDAAVEPDADGPLSDAFMPPTNVGGGNDPHGPLVVSPGLHAVPPAPIVPGPVESAPAAQQASETALAQAVLVEGQLVPDAVPTADAPAGPLDLSDVSSVGEGPDAAVPGDGSAPAKAASKAAWVDYAVAQGVSREEADAATKAELVELYGQA